MRTQRLTVLLGAGGSIPLGVPCTAAITRRVLALDRDPDYLRFAAQGHYRPPFEAISALIASARRTTHDGHDTTEPPNFEQILHALEALQGLVDHPPIVEAVLTAGLADGIKTLLQPSHNMSLASTYLLDTVRAMITSASQVARGHPMWRAYSDFWHQLSERFILDFVTLNYDTLTEDALPSLDDGFRPILDEQSRRFDPAAFSSPPSNGRLIHLHGSVRFGYRPFHVNPNRFAFEDAHQDLYAYPTAEEARGASGGATTEHRSQAGRTMNVGPIITGLQKTDKMVAAQPYMSYYHAATSCLLGTPRLLVIGYSFGDEHISAWLARMPRIHGDRLRLGIIDIAQEFASGRYRLTPRWVKSSLLLNRLSRSDDLDFIRRGIIESNPWVSPTRNCRVDLRGFLASAGQCAEFIDFLGS